MHFEGFSPPTPCLCHSLYRFVWWGLDLSIFVREFEWFTCIAYNLVQIKLRLVSKCVCQFSVLRQVLGIQTHIVCIAVWTKKLYIKIKINYIWDGFLLSSSFLIYMCICESVVFYVEQCSLINGRRLYSLPSWAANIA